MGMRNSLSCLCRSFISDISRIQGWKGCGYCVRGVARGLVLDGVVGIVDMDIGIHHLEVFVTGGNTCSDKRSVLCLEPDRVQRPLYVPDCGAGGNAHLETSEQYSESAKGYRGWLW